MSDEVTTPPKPAKPVVPPTVRADKRTIHERIISILAELPAIGKDQRNEQQKFMYRGHDDVMNALNPLLAKHGVYFSPYVLKRVTGERTTRSGTTMYEVNLCVRYTFWGLAGDYIEATAWGEGTDSGDKSTNKAMTMALKNVLAQVFAVSTAELSDADAESPEPTTRGAASAPAPRGSRKPRQAGRPAVALIPGAMVVKTQADANALRKAEHELDKRQPWGEIEDYCSLSVFGKPREGLNPAERAEFFVRLANAVAKAGDLAGGGDFPPPTHQQITDGYAFAFDDLKLVLRPPAEEPTADEGSVAESGDAPETASELA